MNGACTQLYKNGSRCIIRGSFDCCGWHKTSQTMSYVMVYRLDLSIKKSVILHNSKVWMCLHRFTIDQFEYIIDSYSAVRIG